MLGCSPIALPALESYFRLIPVVPFGHRPANCLQASGFLFRADRTPFSCKSALTKCHWFKALFGLRVIKAIVLIDHAVGCYPGIGLRTVVFI